MEKIIIKICMGTTCFIMCNSELQEIEEEIDPKLLTFIELWLFMLRILQGIQLP
jgi:hypothetical protein